jgi:ABC-type glycerol-3-phosphate transport system substrate-binding protein
MKKIRLVTTILAGLIFSTVFLGCASRQTGVTLKISSWGDLKENSILTELIADFEKTHPGVKVQLQRLPFGEYLTKILTQMAGGTGPDVAFVELGGFSDLVLRGALEPLDPFVQADHMDLKAYYPEVLNHLTSVADGKLYALPRDTAPICVMYYNKSAFDEAGLPYPTDDWDWDGFLAAALKLGKKDASGKVTRWPFVDDTPMWDIWLLDAGGNFADDMNHPTRWTFAEDPNVLKGLQFRADLIHKYKVLIPPASVAAMGEMGSSDLFANGMAALYLCGIWKTPMFREITKFKWDIVMFPKGPGGLRVFPTGGSGYGVMKTSKHKQEAWELVKYLSGEEGAKKLAATGLAQPALMSVANSPAFLDGKDPLNKKMLLEAVKYVKYSPVCKNMGEVHDTLIRPELDKVWIGQETAEEALKKLRPVLKQRPPIQ